MSNLPPGISESTYGAPWNDETYIVEFRFEFEDHNDTFITTFSSNLKFVNFVLSGPFKYTQDELKDCAIDAITDEYPNLIADFCPDIIIERIYAE